MSGSTNAQAERMRRAASILTRAACLARTNPVVYSHPTRKGNAIHVRADAFAMTGLIRIARVQLYGKRGDDYRAAQWALALLSEREPMDGPADWREMAWAARKLRQIASNETHQPNTPCQTNQKRPPKSWTTNENTRREATRSTWTEWLSG